MVNVASSPVQSKIFVSYKRNIEPDHSIAAKVFEALQQQGQTVFIDRTLRAGQEWAREIEAKVRDADFLIVFLTQASVGSEMVKGELEIARDQMARTGSGPSILPVRLAYTGALPYPLNAWIDPLQYAIWRGDSDTGQLIQELVAAIKGTPLSLAPSEFSPDDQQVAIAPVYSAPLPPPGGGLDEDDAWYISRPADAVAKRLILLDGVTLVIKGSRQMGKTSLLVRTLGKAIDAGKRCVLIDFQMLGQESIANSSTFFRRFARSIGESLEIEQVADEVWDLNLSDPQNLTRYMERHILQRIDTPIVLAIDEADILFQANFLYDFFGMLRSWHNARAIPYKKKLWKKLDLALVTSTEPYLFIDRDNESPFNVGEVLALSDFTEPQIGELNLLHESPLFSSEVRRLYYLLNGQPYLTRRAFYLVKSGMTPTQLFAQAVDDRGPFGDHLRNYFLRLLNHPELSSALKQVVLGRGGVDRKLAYRLESAGLVKSESGQTFPRCELYAQYFRSRL